MVAKTQGDIVNDALDIIGAKAAEEAAEPADFQAGARFLNRLVKTWQATGAHLWTRRSANLFYQPGQKRYVIPSSNDKATEEFVKTTTTALATAGATMVTVADATGMATSDEIGVADDTGFVNWSTILTITPTIVPAANVTFGDMLLDDVAAGNRVYTFTTGLGKLLRVPDARRFEQVALSSEGQEIPQVQMARKDYLELPNKDTPGTPVQFYYNPRIDDGEFFVWPVPLSQDQFGTFTYYKPLSEFSTTASIAEFPDEWTEALVWTLSLRLAPIFGFEPTEQTRMNAAVTYEMALNFDQGDESLFLEYSPYRWS